MIDALVFMPNVNGYRLLRMAAPRLEWTLYDAVVKLARKRGWPTYQLAERAELRRNTIGAWKKGVKPDSESLEKVANALGITAGDLWNEVPVKRNPHDLIEALSMASDHPELTMLIFNAWLAAQHSAELRDEMVSIARAIIKKAEGEGAMKAGMKRFNQESPTP